MLCCGESHHPPRKGYLQDALFAVKKGELSPVAKSAHVLRPFRPSRLTISSEFSRLGAHPHPRAGMPAPLTALSGLGGVLRVASLKPRRMNTYEKPGEGGLVTRARICRVMGLNTIECALTKPSKQAAQNEHLHRNQVGGARDDPASKSRRRRMILLQKNRGGGGGTLKRYLRFPDGLAESRGGDALQNPIWRRLRRHQRLRRDQQGLLHGELPGHRGMGHAVSKHHPR